MSQRKKTEYKRVQAIDLDTGEVKGTILVKDNEDVLLKAVNPKQEEAIKKKQKDNKSVAEISQYFKDTEGDFYNLIYKYSFPLMTEIQQKYPGTDSNIHIVRFILLGTYLTFGGNLFDKNRNEIKKSSLGDIWGTSSRNSINETFNLLVEYGYIYEDEKEHIKINKDIAIKGKVDIKELKKYDKDLTYIRVFSENIQRMYENTPPKQRKQLAVLFKILPWINYKYNIFCTNPTETDENEIIPYSWKELAELCGYGGNPYRFKSDLFKLKVLGHEVIGQFETGLGKCIVVNPKVYYAGNNMEDVKNLHVMFKICANSEKK